MKNNVLILLLVLLSACSGLQKAPRQPEKQYAVVRFSVPYENDTIQVNELRFYKIKSALDGTRVLYENYGKWSKKLRGKYQDNINRMVWEELKLLEGEERFTVITDGTETTSDYFTCISVFDAAGEDCFAPAHPLRKPLTDLFVDKITALGKSNGNYALFRERP